MPSSYLVKPPYPEGLMTFSQGHTTRVTSVCVAVGRIVSGSSDTTLRIWNSDGTSQWLAGHNETVSCVCEADGKIVSGSYDNTLRIWDSEGKSTVLTGHTDYVSCVCEANGQIVSGSYDNTLRIWDFDGRSKVLTGHTGWVMSVCVANGNIVSGSADNTLRIWNSDGNCIKVLQGHTGAVTGVCVANGDIVSVSYDKTMRIWDSDGGSKVVNANGEFFTCVCALPDGKIVTGSTYTFRGDATILRVWNSDHTKLLKIYLKDHTLITSIAGISNTEFVTAYNDYYLNQYGIAKWNINTIDSFPRQSLLGRFFPGSASAKVAPASQVAPNFPRSAKWLLCQEADAKSPEKTVKRVNDLDVVNTFE